jgi:hypothetical protein
MKQNRYALKLQKSPRENVQYIISVRDYLDQECYVANLYTTDRDISLYDTRSRLEVLTKRIENGIMKMDKRRVFCGIMEVRSFNDIKYRCIDLPDTLETRGNAESIEIFSNFQLVGQVVKSDSSGATLSVYDHLLLLPIISIGIEYMIF